MRVTIGRLRRRRGSAVADAGVDPAPSWTTTERRIDRAMLTERDPIQMYDELTLYESELDDNGVASRLKVRHAQVLVACSSDFGSASTACSFDCERRGSFATPRSGTNPARWSSFARLNTARRRGRLARAAPRRASPVPRPRPSRRRPSRRRRSGGHHSPRARPPRRRVVAPDTAPAARARIDDSSPVGCTSLLTHFFFIQSHYTNYERDVRYIPTTKNTPTPTVPGRRRHPTNLDRSRLDTDPPPPASPSTPPARASRARHTPTTDGVHRRVLSRAQRARRDLGARLERQKVHARRATATTASKPRSLVVRTDRRDRARTDGSKMRCVGEAKRARERERGTTRTRERAWGTRARIILARDHRETARTRRRARGWMDARVWDRVGSRARYPRAIGTRDRGLGRARAVVAWGKTRHRTRGGGGTRAS